MAFDPTPYLGMGAGIAVGISALAYMIGKFTGKEEYFAFSKSQLVEILIVFLIYIPYTFFDPMLDNIVSTIDPDGFSACQSIKSSGITEVFFDPIPTSMPCYVGTSIVFLDNIFFEIKYFVIQLVALQSLNGIVESVTIESPIKAVLGANMVYNGLPGFVGIAKIITVNVKNISSYLLNAAIFIFVQKYIMLFFYYTGPTLMGIGLFLRLFPVSRKIGGLIMAIVIAQMFIFPLIYALFDNFYRGMDVSPAGPSTSPSGLNLRLVRVHFAIFEDKDVFGGMSVIDKFREVEDSIKNDKYSEKFDSFVDEQIAQTQPEAEKEVKNSFQNIVSSFLHSIFDFFKWLMKPIVAFWRFLSLLVDIILKVELLLFLQTDFFAFAHTLPQLTILDIMIEDLANILIFSYLMTFIAVISLIAVVKDLSPLLGGDVEIAGLTHFV